MPVCQGDLSLNDLKDGVSGLGVGLSVFESFAGLLDRGGGLRGVSVPEVELGQRGEGKLPVVPLLQALAGHPEPTIHVAEHAAEQGQPEADGDGWREAGLLGQGERLR